MRRFNAGGRKSIVRLAFRPDGQALTAQFERSPVLGTWDLASERYDRARPCGEESVACFAYAPDGSEAGVGGRRDGVVRVCGLPGWDCRAELVVGPSAWWPVVAVAFSPAADPRRRWVAAAGNTVQLRNLATGQILADFPEGHHQAVAFSPDGDLLAVADARGVVGWTVSPFRERFTASFEDPVGQIAFSPDGRWLAVGHGMGLEVRPADDPTGRRRLPFRPPDDLAFTPDGRLLAVADASAAVKLLDPATGETVREYDWGLGSVTSVAFSPDGTLAAAGGERGQVVVWDFDG
jgi:WD40 repeat protein